MPDVGIIPVDCFETATQVFLESMHSQIQNHLEMPLQIGRSRDPMFTDRSRSLIDPNPETQPEQIQIPESDEDLEHVQT